MRVTHGVLACHILMGLAASTLATTINVPGDYATIGAAVDAASPHDEIVLQPGTYSGIGNRNVMIVSKSLTVRSQNPDDPAVVAATIIDAELMIGRVLTIINEVTNSVISGLTFFRCRPAIYVSAANPTITKCVFEHNLAMRHGNGGAIECAANSPARIENCTFIGNTAPGVLAAGGAISCSASDPQILFCTFIGNTARKGGAIWVKDYSEPMVRNCIFWRNVACEEESMQIGVDTGTPAVNYCLVEDGTGKPWFGSGCIDTDPLLTADGHLRAGSPCIDEGTQILPNPSPTSDRDGETHSYGTRPDMGSDEFVDSDGNGLPNAWETRYFGGATGAARTGDRDGDALTNIREYSVSSDPTDQDSDDDTWDDGKEVQRGANPVGKNMYVDPVAGDDILNGRSPTYIGGETGPKQHIQSAISAAEHGDTVVLAPGTYSGNANDELDVSMGMGDGWRAITVQSENPYDPAVVAATIVDPQGQGRAFYFHGEMSGLTGVRGLTLRNGMCSTASPGMEMGGAVLCDGASPVIERCVIHSNAATDGGAGGGVALLDSSARVVDCVVSNNTSDSSGGGIHCYFRWGGQYGNPRLINCSVIGNTAAQNGGGIYVWPHRQIIENCIIAENTAADGGGGIWCRDCHLDIRYSTIVSNRPDGVWSAYNTFPNIVNSIIWYNRPLQIDESSPSLYSCSVEGGWPAVQGETQTDDPALVDLESGDFHLQNRSPCIDAATNLASVGVDRESVTRPLDGDGDGRARPDIGAYEFVNPSVDSDGDQVLDHDELASGTDPANGLDYFAIRTVSYESTVDEVLVSWESTLGFLYTLVGTDSPRPTWSTVHGFIDVPGTGDTMRRGVTVSSRSQVYRLKVTRGW